MVKNFTDLEVWKLADELFDMIVSDTTKFPDTALVKMLTNQVTRSIASISANIAEGVGRGGRNELVRYLIMARGSVVESQNWILKIFKLSLIPRSRFDSYMDKFSLTRKKINAFIGTLRKPNL